MYVENLVFFPMINETSPIRLDNVCSDNIIFWIIQNAELYKKIIL